MKNNKKPSPKNITLEEYAGSIFASTGPIPVHKGMDAKIYKNLIRQKLYKEGKVGRGKGPIKQPT